MDKIKTKYFFGSYEKTVEPVDNRLTQYHYLPGGAIYKITDGLEEMLYTYTDHLGSITHITNAAGNLIAEQSFDAWGRYRDPETWTLLNSPFSKGVGGIINGRGYTGHEMLPQFALINMNGRLYDPILGRMLSPDNYIQMPDFTQNFNRYSYVFNNPLKYTDPDGEWVHLVVGAVIGGVTGYITGNMAGATGWNLVGYIGVGALAGAATAGVGAGVSSVLGGGSFGAGFIGSSATIGLPMGGSVQIANSAMFSAQSCFGNGAIIGASGGFTGGFINGTGTSLLQGNSFGESMEDGAIQGGIGAVSGGVLGGIGGGINAVRDNRNFWTGQGNKTFPLSQNKFNQNPPWRDYFYKDFEDHLYNDSYYEYPEGIAEHFSKIGIKPDPNVTPAEWMECQAYFQEARFDYTGQSTFETGTLYKKSGNFFLMNGYNQNYSTSSEMYTPYQVGNYKVFFMYCVVCFHL